MEKDRKLNNSYYGFDAQIYQMWNFGHVASDLYKEVKSYRHSTYNKGKDGEIWHYFSSFKSSSQ